MDDKDRINKAPTPAVEDEAAGSDEFRIAGNVREKGEDPSPDDRDRGEKSSAEPVGEGGAGGTRRR